MTKQQADQKTSFLLYSATLFTGLAEEEEKVCRDFFTKVKNFCTLTLKLRYIVLYDMNLMKEINISLLNLRQAYEDEYVVRQRAEKILRAVWKARKETYLRSPNTAAKTIGQKMTKECPWTINALLNDNVETLVSQLEV